MTSRGPAAACLLGSPQNDYPREYRAHSRRIDDQVSEICGEHSQVDLGFHWRARISRLTTHSIKYECGVVPILAACNPLTDLSAPRFLSVETRQGLSFFHLETPRGQMKGC